MGFFKGYLRALLPSPCNRTTPQPRLGLSPLLVAQRGVEPRRTRRSHNFQGCSVYRFRHCAIVQQGRTAFLNGGRLSLFPLTKTPNPAHTGSPKTVVTAQDSGIGIDRVLPTKGEPFRDHHIVELGTIHGSHRFLQDRDCSVGGNVVLCRVSAASSADCGYVYRSYHYSSYRDAPQIVQEGANMGQLPICAFLCGLKLSLPANQSISVHGSILEETHSTSQQVGVRSVRLAREGGYVGT